MPLIYSGSVLVCGLDSIGCTIAAGLCKSGDFHKLYVYDKNVVTKEDVENISPYFVENDIGVLTRGEAVRNYLYKRFDVEHKKYDVETSFFTGSAGVPEGALSLVDIVIFTTCNRTQLIRYNEYCRAQKPPVCFVNACAVGLLGYTFVDRGIKFHDKSFRYCLLNESAYKCLDLQRREMSDGVSVHNMLNGVAAFEEQNGYFPEYSNKSHPQLVLKRADEFAHLNANDLGTCATAFEGMKESKAEEDMKLASVVSKSSSLPFSPIVNVVSGVALSYVGQNIRTAAMIQGDDIYLDELCTKAPSIEKPLFYFDATSMPLERFELGFDNNRIYVPIKKNVLDVTDDGKNFTQRNYLLFTDGVHLAEAIGAITKLGICSSEESQLTILSTTRISDIQKQRINAAKAKIALGSLLYVETSTDVDYDTIQGVMIFCLNGNSQQLELFVNECMKKKIPMKFLACIIAPETADEPHKFITTPSVPSISESSKGSSNYESDGNDSEDEEKVIPENQIKLLPYLWISGMTETQGSAITAPKNEDEITLKAFNCFLDRFIGIDEIIAAMTKNTNFLYSVNLLNQREYQSTKRYHEVLTSISILVGFLAENQNRNNKKAKLFIIQKVYQMFQTTFPYLIKEEHLKNDASVLEKRKLYVKSACNLYLYVLKQSDYVEEVEALIDEYENTFAKKMEARAKYESALAKLKAAKEAKETKDVVEDLQLEVQDAKDAFVAIVFEHNFNETTLNGVIPNSEPSKDIQSVPKYLFESIKYLNESLYGQKRFMLFFRWLNPSAEVKAWSEELVTLTAKLFRLEDNFKHGRQQSFVEEDKEWVKYKLTNTFGYKHYIRDASCQLACGLFAIEIMKSLACVSVMNDDSDDKIYEVVFESYDDANRFAKANALEVRCIEYKDENGKSVKYQAQKEVVQNEFDANENSESEEDGSSSDGEDDEY